MDLVMMRSRPQDVDGDGMKIEKNVLRDLIYDEGKATMPESGRHQHRKIW